VQLKFQDGAATVVSRVQIPAVSLNFFGALTVSLFASKKFTKRKVKKNMAEEKSVEEKKQEFKLGVAIPLYNQVPSVFFKSFINFFVYAVQKHHIKLFSVDSTAVDVARNVLVEKFLKSNCTHLLFLDSDMVFPPEIVDLLLKHDKDFISALYVLRKAHRPCYRFKDGDNYKAPEKIEPNKLLEVDAVGLGTCLLKRSVLEKTSSDNDGKPLFKIDYKSRTEIFGEDVYFCKLAKKSGFKVFVDTSVLVGHFGGIIPESAFKGFIF